MTSEPQLSKADSKVLAQVFDPESGPTKPEILVDPSLPSDRNVASRSVLATLQKREREAIGFVESFERLPVAQRTPEKKTEMYFSALTILDNLIDECPKYASARNNRAQVRRWRFGDRNLLCRGRSSEAQDDESNSAGGFIVQDLRESIALALPSRPQDPVSPAQGRLLAQAHTQLGAVYHVAAQDMDRLPSVENQICCDAVSGWTKEMLEEEASRLFYLGGLYGNEVAKALAVHTNPHAKLCGNIVQEAMKKEMGQA